MTNLRNCLDRIILQLPVLFIILLWCLPGICKTREYDTRLKTFRAVSNTEQIHLSYPRPSLKNVNLSIGTPSNVNPLNSIPENRVLKKIDPVKRVIIKGSTSAEPIVRAFTQYFGESHPETLFSIQCVGSGNGITSLIDGQCDIACISRMMKDTEFKDAVKNNVYPVFHEIIRGGIAVVVHPDNPVSDLNMSQLRELFSGKITNWADVGGRNAEVIVIMRDHTSGTREEFDEHVLLGAPPANGRIVHDNAAVQAAITGTPGAIGYISLGFLKGTKTLKINGIEPCLETINNGYYPISRPLFMVTNGYPVSGSAVHSIVTMSRMAYGRRIIGDLGWFVPDKEPWEKAIGEAFSRYWFLFIAVVFFTGLLALLRLNRARVRLHHAVIQRDKEIAIRTKAQSEQKAAMKKFNKVFDTTSSMMIAGPAQISEETGDVHFFTEYVNDVLLEKLACKKADVIGRQSSQIGFLANEEISEIINHLSIGDSIKNRELIVQANDGHPVSVLCSGAQFYADNTRYILLTLTDITEQKRVESEKESLQAQLLHAQKMEAIGLLAGGVAHDLNNVLSGIVSYPDLILMDLPEDSHLRKLILTMQSSGKKAAAIVQDLLTLARRGVHVNEVINLNSIIIDYLHSSEFNKLKSFHPNAQIKCNLEKDLLPVLGSSVHLSNTIMNLISNAAEAICNEGLIRINTANQYIDKPIKGYDKVKKGNYIVLTVSDNGIGISHPDLERIFEPFYTKKTMGRSGTGLGMAVVWGTVKDLEGYIDIDSIEGKGTTFRLFIPATDKRIEREESTLPINKYMGNGERILVVDDMKEQREIARILLEKLNYTIDTAACGEEAVEYIRKKTVDLIILDMIMSPGIDGLDTYKRILEMHPGQKAIIASGFSETARIKKAQQLGAVQYLKKPYALEQIGMAIKTALVGSYIN